MKRITLRREEYKCVLSLLMNFLSSWEWVGLDMFNHVIPNKVSFGSLPQNESSIQEPSSFPISTIHSFWTMQLEPAIEFIHRI